MDSSDQDGLLPSVGEIIQIKSLMGVRFIVASRHEGGMGVVFRLNQMNPQLPDLALKLLAVGTDFSQAEREARIWISIGTGPFIAQANWGGMWRGRPAILSRWYPGVASSIGPKQWRTSDFLTFARDLTFGLKYAYDVGGIIHRDIKPSNVLLDDDFHPYVTDFGIALLANRPVKGLCSVRDIIFESNRTIATHGTAGTPPYMAPELFSGADATVGTDIYSLGVTLYQLLTGEHPYAGPETNGRFSPSLRMAPLEMAILQISTQREAIRNLILSTVALDPSSRCSSYDRLLTLLPKVILGPDQQHSPNQLTAGEFVDAAATVNLATAHRNQGNPDLAEKVLREALARMPTDPLILNAWGVQAVRRGQESEATSAWSKACQRLEESDGLYSGAVYADPLVNLARNLVLNFDHQSAASWLRKGRVWGERHNPKVLRLYPEFGWLSLFEGAIEDARLPLHQHLLGTHSDVVAGTWFALARVIGNYGQETESLVCRTFEGDSIWSSTTTIAALVTALTGKSQASIDLRRRAIPAFTKCRTADGLFLGKALGLQDLSINAFAHIIQDLICMLDGVVTGGKNREMVR